MSLQGTSLYADLTQAVPPLVTRAVDAAKDADFDLCVHPATGRLLQVLAAGVPPGGLVGETGTGTGAGLAWMVSGADPRVQFLSVEIDETRAAIAQHVFAAHDNVTIYHADAGHLFDRGPFDMLVHDGGWGSGKAGSDRIDASSVLKENAVMTVDDYTPMRSWPPTYQGAVDESRQFWLCHPDMLATEIQVAPDMAVVVARYTPGK